jgi:hypothetical protein
MQIHVRLAAVSQASRRQKQSSGMSCIEHIDLLMLTIISLVCGMMFTRVIDLSDEQVQQTLRNAQNELPVLERVLPEVTRRSPKADEEDYQKPHRDLAEHYGVTVPRMPEDNTTDISVFRRVRLVSVLPYHQTRKVWCSIQAWTMHYNDHPRGETVYGWCSVIHVSVQYSDPI